jgi:hypothetical protein
MLARVSYPLLFAALAWGAFSAFTLYRLGSRRSAMGATTYTYGVKRFGIGLWLISILLEVGIAREASTAHPPLWLHVLLVAFVTLPLCLWVGYAWGKAMHALLPRTPRKRPKGPTPP